MGYLDDVMDISELGQRKLVVIYGKSNSGKTVTAATFPKPLLYLRVGDDGSNSIAKVEGIKAKPILSTGDLNGVLKELIKLKGKNFQTVVIDTFSLYTNMWTDENAVKKNKKMTQQMWGDLKTDTEEVIRLAHQLSQYCWVILTCHEVSDSFEGLEDEIAPDIRASVSKGARTYLEGMANYGIHTTKLKKTVIKDGVEQTIVRYGAHIGPNEYYWTKLQIDKGIKVPSLIINPSHAKIMKIIEGE